MDRTEGSSTQHCDAVSDQHVRIFRIGEPGRKGQYIKFWCLSLTPALTKVYPWQSPAARWSLN
jgi:hypothetical protein